MAATCSLGTESIAVANDGKRGHSVEVRPAPFSARNFVTGTLRPVLSVAGRCGGVTIKRPHARLPLLASSDVKTLFELPVLSSWELPSNVSTVMIELERDGLEPTIEELPSASLRDDGDNAKLDLQYVHDHVDAIGEFFFPSTPQVRQRSWRSGGVVAAPWDALHAAFRRHLYNGGRLALIVQVAHACQDVLHGLCTSPRQLLRRERRTTDIGRADQLDEECLRWLVRQPGTTVLEKAGARQRIRAVRRTHSYDTTENRVIRDFLERCRRACDAYLLDSDSGSEGLRMHEIRVFRRNIKRWLTTSPIGQVPRPVGIPGANYVLQFDDRYRRIWPWYERLRRQQEEEAGIRRWRHRLWAEHVLLLMAQAVVSKDSTIAYRGRAYVRMLARHGHFVDNVSYFDSVHCGSEQARCLRVLSAGGSESAIAEVKPLAPDGVLYDIDRSGTPLTGTSVGIWSALVPVTGSQMAEHGEVLAAELRSSARGSRGILVLPMRSLMASQRAGPIAVEADGDRVLVIALPIRSFRHVSWLRMNVVDWIERRT